MENLTFDKQNNMCSDSCWQQNKNIGNNKITNYYTYQTQLMECEENKVRMPDFIYDHINLRGRPGYGLADSCLIDNYSELVNNKEVLTRDRCRIQLFKRLFNAGPTLKGSNGNIDRELDILTGSDTTFYMGGTNNDGYGNINTCKKGIMEQQIKQPIPLIDCLKDIQNPEHIIPLWTNGGESTRMNINLEC
jgi:hypothetical protein